MKMPKMTTALELYQAAKETCIRLYVANGGSRHDNWRVQPYPGTAAIACVTQPSGSSKLWTLCMPALPLDQPLPVWMAELLAAYTIHEECHALFTDFTVIPQAAR